MLRWGIDREDTRKPHRWDVTKWTSPVPAPWEVSCRCHFVGPVAVDLFFLPSILEKCITTPYTPYRALTSYVCVEHFRSRRDEETKKGS